jgi:large subunit ribosomal protein L24
MACTEKKKEIRFSNSPIKLKQKFGGTKVVSRALVKPGSTDLTPSMHVRAGDMVMVISGSKEHGKGKTGKVLNVFPDEGKIIVEGVNVVTRATKARNQMAKSGHIKKEGKIFASKVMLYCTSCKKPTRIKHKELDSGKNSRVCQHCKETFDS